MCYKCVDWQSKQSVSSVTWTMLDIDCGPTSVWLQNTSIPHLASMWDFIWDHVTVRQNSQECLNCFLWSIFAFSIMHHASWGDHNIIHKGVIGGNLVLGNHVGISLCDIQWWRDWCRNVYWACDNGKMMTLWVFGLHPRPPRQPL